LANLVKETKWFQYETETVEHSLLGATIKTLVGVIIGSLVFFGFRWHSLGIVIWTITAIIGVVTLGSQRGRTGVGNFFAALGRSLGWGLSIVLLVPVFLIGFTAAHFMSWVTGRDKLHLRDGDSQTYWLPVDNDRRKVRHIRAMFATEAVDAKGGRSWAGIAVLLGAMLVSAEILLRLLGYGSPILYVQDVRAGYYPGPNQSVSRSGGLVETNRFGMRAPEIEPEKPAGVFRILMIGDSTLWGGSYIDQSELYARRVANSFEEQYGKNQVEVLNIGVNGWGPFNKLGYLERFGTFDADLAIICLPNGDIYRDLCEMTDIPYFPVGAPPRLALEEVVQHLLWRRSMKGKRPTAEQREERGVEGIAAYVKLAQKLRDAGCDVLIEILPSRTAGTTEKIPSREEKNVEDLRAALEPHGFVVGHSVGLFQGQGDTDKLYHDSCHLHALGHQIYSKYLKERIQQQSRVFRRWASRSVDVAEQKGESE